MNLKELLNLDPYKFKDQDISQEEILTWFSLLDASWVHDGDPAKPHAELTSSWCSNGFFDCLRVLKHLNLSEILAYQLTKKIRSVIGGEMVDWVVASPMAGITFGHDVARQIGAKKFMFTEKDPDNPGAMLWKRVQIPEGETVLQIEELTTTSKTLNAVRQGIEKGNHSPVNWLPVVGILVHRPPQLPAPPYDDRTVVALIEKEVWAVPPEECPLCKAGSKRYRPKTNWKELTGKA